MSNTVQFQVSPEEAKDELFLRKKIRKNLKLRDDDFIFRWKKRSIDARRKQIKINCVFDVFLEGEEVPPVIINPFLPGKLTGKKIGIIGFGPAGIFAALQALKKGIKPVIFERGKEVRARRRDLANITKNGIINPESNYCFGEGGAGTYSDGKLYTRSKKKGDVRKVLEWFVQFGASEDILIDAHPHIGTNKLPKIIQSMREEIIHNGGEVHFESKVTDILVSEGKVKGLEVNHQYLFEFDKILLATGHSARDIYELFTRNGWQLESKPFAMGVRIEHPQDLIDKIQYHGRLNDDFLPPASYRLVTQVNGRGVYSFCMCPGGIVAPCATGKEEVVTNGWSPSKRNNPFANSGIVVSISPDDFEDKDALAGLRYQKELEKKCWEAAGRNQKVPAQRLLDFIENKKSENLPVSSYHIGLTSVNLNELLPPVLADSLRKAFLDFNKKMKGFLTNEAVLHAPESRTSSPVKIPRNKDFQHPQIKGLYPCAEGSGYAGGIVSAAIDGINCVEKMMMSL